MTDGFNNAFEGLQIHLLVPDLWQQEAIRFLKKGEDVIVSAPTGAGKTYIFENLVDDARFPPRGEQAVYTVPTRALANEKWREWRRKGWNVGIATGDLAENIEAPILVATLETQRERFLAGNGPHLLVIDEYQMIADRQRGLNYELAIALAPPNTRLLLLSGSVGNPTKVREWMETLGRTVHLVTTEKRPVPLDEIPLEALPRTAPRKYSNYWQRLSLGVLLSNYGPLLIFAPHRKAAEKIAWKVAEALPEDAPIQLGEKQLEQICPPDLRRLLCKRVSYHHSGLGYAERAAIVEPLAKAGQLRVIVATMGLAAGINFSVRSVFVSETSYRDGPFQREVSPDELLQMFGRAGRRGLDETGYLITGNRSPHLSEGRPLEIRRTNELDWPTLLRRMSLAASEEGSPIEAARELRDRLFSKQRIPLGFQAGAAHESENSSEPLFDLKPTSKEVRNGNGEWEKIEPNREHEAEISKALSFNKGRYRPAESDSALISSLLPKAGRLCRLEQGENGHRRYGVEFAVATEVTSGFFRLTKAMRMMAGNGTAETEFSREEVESFLPDILATSISPATFETLVQRGKTMYLAAHFRSAKVSVYQDSIGNFLHQPQLRSVIVESETHVTEAETGNEFEPTAGTPAHAWRKLRLIDDRGIPTDRGRIMSLFQGGEGLAIAAALEDPHYPIEEIILHLVNLRAGHRFDLDSIPHSEKIVDSVGSERLAVACRQAYGPVDFEGYLQLGLPPNYGEGAAEVVSMMLNGKLHRLFSASSEIAFGPGDVDRAFVEWLSLLRHIRHAPDIDITRWEEFQSAATHELSRRDRKNALLSLPEIPASVLQKAPRHGIPISAL